MSIFTKEALEKIRKGIPITIWVDIDGTLCDSVNKGYENAIPIEAMIGCINYLYDQGHTIILVTARGATSGIDWRELTERELQEWGLKYHRLMMGTPKDLYIGDETFQPEEFICDLMDVIE